MTHSLNMRAAFSALLVATLVFAGLAAATASAQDHAPAVGVQFLMDGEGDNGFLLVNGTLPPEVSLPATLTLPLPTGARLWWAGEIAGGDSADDIAREVSVRQGDGGQVVEFSLEETRSGQYDALYLPTQVTGDRRENRIVWVQSSPASQLTFSVVFPLGAQDVEMEPDPVAAPARNALGNTLYVLEPVEEPELGATYEVFAGYTVGIGPSSQAADDLGGLGITVLVLVGLVAVLVIGLVLVLRAQSKRREAMPQDDTSEEPVEP